ncbi:hypothetical protein J4453_03435 [Candidatus Woesearchaeota archaeon]|nr:hypothetical protein [Candidatus Woesearchaeota archaeon]
MSTEEYTEIKKSTIYAVGIILLISVVGYFMLKGSGKNTIGGLAEAVPNGDPQEVTIGMKNYNYYPNTINVKAGRPVRIRLDGTVYGWPQDILEFTPTQPGMYAFACSMGMGRGVLVVE